MNNLDDYIKAMGMKAQWFTFDGGRRLAITGRGARFDHSHEWGEEASFDRFVRRYLDAQPWPTEDDPRVKHEGAYL